MEIGFIDTIFRLLLAGVLGGVIGFEREKKHQSAGFRTHILVCTGSAMIMLLALYMNQSIYSTNYDAAKIVAGVVTGIGFLGAGAILKSQEHVIGLTTAASVWVSAGVGLLTGAGYIAGAVAQTVIAFITLFFLRQVETGKETASKGDSHG